MLITIRQKFIAACGLVFLAIVGILYIGQSTTNTLKDYDAVKIGITELEAELLMLRRNEKDFLSRKNLKYQEKFKENFLSLDDSLSKLDQAITQVGLNKGEVQRLEIALSAYKESFHSLVSEQQKIGLDSKDGLYGALRQAVHKAEKRIADVGLDELRANMLQLRRNEKDFMLRLDSKYLDKFDKNIAVFSLALQNSNLSENMKQSINQDMNDYQTNFHSLVEGNKRKGLSSNEGLRGVMRNKVHNAEDVLDKLSSHLDELVEAEVGDIEGYLILTNSVGIFLGLFAVVVLLWLCRSILASINSVLATIQTISEDNDLSIRVETRLMDEIGQMGAAINKMLENFQLIIEGVNQSSINVTQSTSDMKTVAEKTMSDLSEQQNQTEEVAAAMSQMSVTVQDVAKNAVRASESAFEANQESLSGKEIVDISAQTICEVAKQIENASDSIKRVEIDSDRIGSVLEVIKDIADQTNLLALNAAIEAARAGEQGRGFAVVADEVRTLASRTQESTQEIQEMVESLQTGAKQAVVLMSESHNKIQDGVEQSTQAGGALEKIVIAVEKINDMNMQIASAMEEHGAVSLVINGNIDAINNFASKTLVNTKQFVSSSNDIIETVEELGETVSQFK